MIGIIAGEGLLPKIAQEKIEENELSYIIGFEKCKYEFIKPNVIVSGSSMMEIIELLKKNNINKIILCGAIKFSGLKHIKLDSIVILLEFLKLKFFNNNIGDDLLLKTAIRIFAKYNIEVIKIQDIDQNILIKKQDEIIFSNKNSLMQNATIGLNALDVISKIDLGQSIVISNKRILAIEGIEGTSELIKRCGDYLLEEKMLVKSSKTNQDMRADVATIGPSTIDQLHENNFNAIALKENAVLVINKQLVTEKLKQYSISLLVL